MRRTQCEPYLGYEEEREPGQMARTISTVLLLLCMGLCLFIVTCLQVVITDGPSMEPTYYSGDRLLVLKAFGAPESGDIVLIQHDGVQMVKRVIAAAGEQAVTLAEPNGTTTVTKGEYTWTKPTYPEGIDAENGRYVCEELRYYRPWDDGYRADIEVQYFGPWTHYFYWDTQPNALVPDGYVFVAGDNSENSYDSRDKDFGLVSEDEILGYVIWKFPSSADGIPDANQEDTP